MLSSSCHVQAGSKGLQSLLLRRSGQLAILMAMNTHLQLEDCYAAESRDENKTATQPSISINSSAASRGAVLIFQEFDVQILASTYWLILSAYM